MNASRKLYRLMLIIVAAVTLIRVAVLVLTPLQLYPDEAQYWWWAQTPAFGYFSKPPMIAWAVWLTTAVFGDGEWAIRLGSPLLHAATALLLFGIARLTFDARTGFWTAAAYLTLPGVSYSAGLVSTDVPLLFFWALTLYAFLRALDEPGWRWPLLCGLSLGLGLLSKYAMLYFVLGAVLSAIALPKARALVFSTRGLAILAIGLLLLAPNVAWNAAHGFPTVAHTAANADWSHARYSLMNVAAFIGGQFGVFGPLMMVGLILAVWRLARDPARAGGPLTLAAFCVPPLVIISVQSFISEANANWAATAYVAAAPLAVAALLKLWRGRALWGSLAFNVLAMLVLWTIYLSPSFADMIGQGNGFKRLEGWRELGSQVAASATAGRYDTIAAANRSVVAELLYYARPRSAAVRMWDQDLHDDDHFQMTMRLTIPAPRVLLVILPDEARAVLPTFASAAPIRAIVIPVGGHHTRTTLLLDARDYRGPQTPR